MLQMPLQRVEVRCRISGVGVSLADKGALTVAPQHLDAHISFVLLDAELVDRIHLGCH